jgi:hypothetical protein
MWVVSRAIATILLPLIIAAQTVGTKQRTDLLRAVKVYIVDLPAEFNHGLVRRALELHKNGSVSNPGSSIRNIINYGLGATIPRRQYGHESSPDDWYNTHQFNLEMILHHKLLSHRVRTLDPLEADIFWVPYYPAFGAFFAVDPSYQRAAQVLRHERGLLTWLEANGPKYHTERWRYVLPLGCVSHQFLVPLKENWGSNLLAAEGLLGMNIVGIESMPGCSEVCWGGAVDACTRRCHGVSGQLSVRSPLIGVPYPSFYHALRGVGDAGDEYHNSPPWMGQDARTILAAFIGEATHGQVTMPLRVSIIANCQARPAECFVASAQSIENEIMSIIEVYRRSFFCLQPPGDTATRRGIFDAIMCGCVPVLFSPDQLGGVGGFPLQYQYHLPRPADLSILVPIENQSNVLGYLSAIARDKDRMRLLQAALKEAAPMLQYAHPKDHCQLGGALSAAARCEPDALDVLLRGLAEGLREGRVA